jgi:hypothetical protein
VRNKARFRNFCKEPEMKKLMLKVDELQVNSFDTGKLPREEGTVHGAAITTTACTNQWTCGIYCPPTTDPKYTGPCAC